MNETKTHDHTAKIHEEIRRMNERRGLVAAELDSCELELGTMRDGAPGHQPPAHRHGALALDAILGDEGAAAEIAEIRYRETHLAERAELCRQAMAHADEMIEGLRRTWLQGTLAAAMPLEEIPEILRERVREARERADA